MRQAHTIQQLFVKIRCVENEIEYNKQLELVGVHVHPFERYRLAAWRHYLLKRLLKLQLKEFARG